MRWDLVDRFEVLKKGVHSRAVKSYGGHEDFFPEHFPSRPRVPEPFFLEMIAQTGGVLYGLSLDFKKEVILVQMEEVNFFQAVAPPCDLRIDAHIEEEREEGAWIRGTVSAQSGKVAQARIFLAAIDSLVEGKRQIVFSDSFMKRYGVLEVARQSEAISVP